MCTSCYIYAFDVMQEKGEMEINIFDIQNEDTPWNLLCDPYTKNGNEKDSCKINLE